MGLEELEQQDYFSIGDVKRITGVPEYSIRYWESEFHLIRPVRFPSGHRRYSKEDVYTILKIKDLIYKHKLTLEGAKKQLGKYSLSLSGEKNAAPRTNVKFLTKKKEILANLDKLSELAFDDQCTGGNARYPLISEIKNLYLKAYYGEPVKHENK